MDQIVTLETAKLAMEVGFTKRNVTHLCDERKYSFNDSDLVTYTTPPIEYQQ